uniref:ML domain-containing protein n=1 Tax=Rhabditophanes sp. KR3021 TaxID=114890 RepID=A0AC35TH57_9BILA
MKAFLNIILVVALATLVNGTCMPMRFSPNPVLGYYSAYTDNSVDDETGWPCSVGAQTMSLSTEMEFHFEIHFDYTENLVSNQANFTIFDQDQSISGSPFCTVNTDVKTFTCPPSLTNKIIVYYVMPVTAHPKSSMMPQFTIAALSTRK